MASCQNSTCGSTRPTKYAGVKRARVQESQRSRKSARLEKLHRNKLASTNSCREGGRHGSDSNVWDEKSTQPHQQPVSRKRPRAQTDRAPRPPECRKRRRLRDQEDKLASPGDPNEDKQHPIAYWALHKKWPERFPEKSDNMENILARKRSISSRNRKSSETGSATPSSTNQGEPKSREQKSAEYRKPQYATVLATKGVFMEESELDISRESKRECKRLLEREGETPEHSLFRDDLFKATCKKIQDKNEARVIQDITRLIAPSAETLTTYGATDLKCLIESVNEGWNNSIPITKTRPQSDYAVGFRREAFTQEQLDRMHPVVGDFKDQSFFMATWYMYFPFLTCEVKCGAAALDIADRQNAHSAAIAVRAVVELFRTVKRERELHREILAFSISHDHRSVRIYGYYAEIEESEAKYYRHPIREFSFTELDGKEKWTAYKFTKNVYDNWMPMHFKRICSAIDQIPADISFSVSQSELHYPEQSSGLSQDLSAYSVAQSSVGPTSKDPQDDTESSIIQDPVVTPSTSVHEGAPFKKPRNEHFRRGRK